MYTLILPTFLRWNDEHFWVCPQRCLKNVSDEGLILHGRPYEGSKLRFTELGCEFGSTCVYLSCLVDWKINVCKEREKERGRRMERTRQSQEKEEWGMLQQIKVITVYLHRGKGGGPVIDHICTIWSHFLIVTFIVQQWKNPRTTFCWRKDMPLFFYHIIGFG